MTSADFSSSRAAEVLVFPDAQSACLAAAAWLAEVIERAQRERGRAVLGLPTGSTPKAVYAKLVKRYREEALSFQDVTTYNLDEYYPVSPLDVQQLSRLHGRKPVSSRRPCSALHPRLGRHGARGVRIRGTRRITTAGSTTTAAWTSSFWESAATATSGSTSRAT